MLQMNCALRSGVGSPESHSTHLQSDRFSPQFPRRSNGNGTRNLALFPFPADVLSVLSVARLNTEVWRLLLPFCGICLRAASAKHSALFIRDTVKMRLALSLISAQCQTSFVLYLSQTMSLIPNKVSLIATLANSSAHAKERPF